MRLRAFVFAVLAIGGASAGAWTLAGAATDYVERASAVVVRTALDAAGLHWTRIETDGLRVSLGGLAPDEGQRFRAVEIARQVVDPDRVEDATALRRADPLAPPPFAVEFLRNEAEVSLIGLAPEGAGRATIRAALDGAGLGAAVTDMLETTAADAPKGWSDSLAFALQILAELPRARISVAPGDVGVIAVADSEAARAALLDRLAAAAPPGVDLALDVSAPRPVLAPFLLDFRLEQGVARLEACSAETEAAVAEILTAARAAGLAGNPACDIGLGAPTLDWAAAAARGIAAVTALGGGGFALTDTAAVLTGPAEVTPETLVEAARVLAEALPAGYTLATIAAARPEAGPGGATVPPPRFAAERHADGTVTLSGPVADAPSQSAIEGFAAAVFGHDAVHSATVIDTGLPAGWPVRVLAGLEALAEIKAGRLDVTPGTIALEGWDIAPDPAARVEALLASKDAGDIEIDVRFDAAAAAADAAANRPAPELCAEEVAAILDSEQIGFRAGSAEIDPASRGLLAAIADVLRTCPGAIFEVAGHTDAQGEPDVNQRLSDARATAVAEALRAHDLPLVTLSPRGYGAARPISENASASGRAQNRRIEIALLTPEQLAAAAAPPAPAAEVAEPPAPAACLADVADLLAEAPVAFASGSAEIAAEGEAAITSLAAALAGCDGRFEIAGHTDDRGSAEGNLTISEDRAEAVRAALIEAGVPDTRLVARGYGEARPLTANDSSDGRARNRRIEITLLPEAAATGGQADGPAGQEDTVGPQ